MYRFILRCGRDKFQDHFPKTQASVYAAASVHVKKLLESDGTVKSVKLHVELEIEEVEEMCWER